MREIKFRAWDADAQKMFVPNAISNDGKAVIILSKNEGCKYDSPLMQFTGLHDKNRNEIYEGDIVKRGDIGKSVVGFAEGAFVLEEGENEPIAHYHHETWKVIGNIYENPQLLELSVTRNDGPPRSCDAS